MKKIVSMILVLVLAVSFLPLVSDAKGNYLPDSEIKKHQEIDKVIEELNQIACEKAHQRYLSATNTQKANVGYNVLSTYGRSRTGAKTVNQLEARQIELKNQLKNLGVNEIDVNNSDDMVLLNEMSKESTHQRGISTNATDFDYAPDLSAIASMYTLYVYDGNYNYKGATYSYRYITVVDDKGYDRMLKIEMLNAIDGNSYLLRDILSYNFSYAFSAFLGVIPGGTLINWTLGNIFTLFNEVDSSTIVSSSGPLYTIKHVSVTSMTYYWIYNAGWKYIGAGATCSVARTDTFSGNVEGRAVDENVTTNWTTRTPGVWYNYLEDYINANNPSFCQIRSLGSFRINGKNSSLTFTPIFCGLPIELI